MFTFQRELVVEWGDCDPAGIVYNPRFLAYFDTSSALLLSALGWPKRELLDTCEIIGVPIVDVHVRFLVPASFGETVLIRSEVTDVRRSSFDIHHQLFKGDQLCVDGKETRVWTGRDPGPPPTLKSKPIPGLVRQRMMGELPPLS